MDRTFHEQIAEAVYSSSEALDEERYEHWLDALCHEEFRYRITAYSPEIKKQMTWLEHTRPVLRQLCANLPEQVSYLGKFHRHTTVCRVRWDQEKRQADAVSSLFVVHTDANGESKLYASGRYIDTFCAAGARPLLLKREVALDTRLLPFGSHRPL